MATLEDMDGEEELKKPRYELEGRKPDRIDIVSRIFPGAGDQRPQTLLDPGDAALISVLNEYENLWPEVRHHQPIIDGFIEEYIHYRLSEEGEGFEAYINAIMAMYGGKPDDETTVGETLARALADTGDE